MRRQGFEILSLANQEHPGSFRSVFGGSVGPKGGAGLGPSSFSLPEWY